MMVVVPQLYVLHTSVALPPSYINKDLTEFIHVNLFFNI